MNNKIFSITGLVVLGLISVIANADPADVNLSKTSLNVDFNKMIDEGAHTKKNIQKHIDAQIAVTEEDEINAAEKSRVLDFVDAEMKVGPNAPTVVDRRYNSVADPIDLSALVPNFYN